MLNLKRGKGFQKSAANPLLKRYLKAEKSVQSIFEASLVGRKNPFCPVGGLRFASARCLEIVCGTIATPTSAHIVERVTVGFTSACRMILRSSLPVVFLAAPDPVFRSWVPSRVHCFQQFLMAHSK
ncbi:uncharacterized protein TNCV_4732011 [Trichonephila clavipes]|nr:uncharacterized protein TNCV_4732011 [Trichonephila clavipes]